MINRSLHKDLLDSLGISKQALSQQAKRIKLRNPMSTEDAICIIAQQNGFLLDKYYDQPYVDRIRGILKEISIDVERPNRKKSATSENGERIIQIANEFTISDPILSDKKVNESKEMASIYPLLYVLENSIREFIDKKMTFLYGKDWWEKKATRKLKDTVDKNMSNENKHSWHQRRGAREIDYLDFVQLVPLVKTIENDIVPEIIPSIEWFSQLVEEVYQSRCVLCHMNPLDKDSVESVKLRFRQWQRQIGAKTQFLG